MLKIVKKTKITLPTYEEVRGRVCLVTDYAQAAGVVGDHYRMREDGVKGFSGAAWLRTCSHFSTGVDIIDPWGRWEWDYASSENVGVMPRILNPEAMGFGVTQVEGQSFLTLDDLIAYYPAPFVGKKMEKRLDHVQKNGKGLTEVAELANGRTIMEYEGDYYTQRRVKRYPIREYFQDETPIERGQHWFKNARVPAERCPDGSIQCLEIVNAYPFESQREFNKKHIYVGHCDERYVRPLNTNNFAIGRKLNEDWVSDLRLCTALEHHRFQHKLRTVNLPTGGFFLKNFENDQTLGR